MLCCLGHTLQKHRRFPHQLAPQGRPQAAQGGDWLGAAADVRVKPCLWSAEMRMRTAAIRVAATASLTQTLACTASTVCVPLKSEVICELAYIDRAENCPETASQRVLQVC